MTRAEIGTAWRLSESEGIREDGGRGSSTSPSDCVQERGFNGFSYADVARELDVTKAALHYHFASKAELGDALIERYAERFFDALSSVEGVRSEAPVSLRAYAKLYADVFRDDRMCLCGMLAADYATLPEPIARACRPLLRRQRGVALAGPGGRPEGRAGDDQVQTDRLARSHGR